MNDMQQVIKLDTFIIEFYDGTIASEGYQSLAAAEARCVELAKDRPDIYQPIAEWDQQSFNTWVSAPYPEFTIHKITTTYAIG